MAESFLFSIAESLVAKLASRAFEEASRVVGLKDHLRDLQKTLSYVKAVLLDAEQKQEHNHELQEWLRQLKTVFYDAEGVLDEFECQTLRKKVVKAHGTIKDEVSHFFSSSNPLLFRSKMAQQIKDVSKRLDKVAADRHKFGLQTNDVDRRVVHRRDISRMTHSRVNDSDVIGRENDKEKIIELLMQQNPNDDDKTLSVIPIVGIGGLGKTTLAKFVFNDKRIDECFTLKMWVCVSHDFDINQLIIKIINSAADAPLHPQNLSTVNLEQSLNQLKNKLVDQKFLLVLDDVWNEDPFKWVELRNLIQVGAAPGSKILVTTRNPAIASMMGTVTSHKLQGLSSGDSLSLFVKCAFKEKGQEEKYPHLLNIGKEIVKKCLGVPLAVRTLGSLVYSKFDANDWGYVRDNEIWNLPQEDHYILPALKLSYDFLPSYLRQCFALFSSYPKDHVFFSDEVTRHWRALGLLASPRKNETPEDVAKQYLDELLSRSFLQDFFDFGTFYRFKMHDLVHDLALFVAKDVWLLINSHIEDIPENIRHLSFAECSCLGDSFTSKSAAVRTIMFPNGAEGANVEALLNTCVSKFKLLRVLDLSESTCKTLPRSIGKLKHLRYFSIARNRNIKRLPNSICKLQNLQFLSVLGCNELEALPKGLKKLVSLRHLEITTKQPVMPYSEITNLISLAELCIVSSHNMESIFGGVKFPALKTLYVLHCDSLKYMALDVTNFPELETLIVLDCVNLDLDLWKDHHEEQNPMLKLKFVEFWGLPQLVALPQWLQETANSLQTLLISKCDNLEMLPEWQSTLTKLKVLQISDCPKLISLPDNIHHLTALENLEIEGCPELCKKYEPHVGEFWSKISHIKDVFIEFKIPYISYFEAYQNE